MWVQLKMNCSAHAHHNEGTCHPAHQCCLFFMFLIFFWTAMAQKNKIHQAIATLNILSMISALFLCF